MHYVKKKKKIHEANALYKINKHMELEGEIGRRIQNDPIQLGGLIITPLPKLTDTKEETASGAREVPCAM